MSYFLCLRSTKLAKALDKVRADREAENAEIKRMKEEREKVLANAKAKADAELRQLECSDEAASVDVSNAIADAESVSAAAS